MAREKVVAGDGNYPAVYVSGANLNGPNGIEMINNSDGTWELSNNDNNLLITDQTSGIISDYQILSVQESICFLNGNIPFVIDTMGLTINSVIEIELQLVGPFHLLA